MPRNTPSSTLCLYASLVEGRFSGFGLSMEKNTIGHYFLKRGDGSLLSKNPEKAIIQIRIAPPKCDEVASAVFMTCSLHELSCPPCCEIQHLPSLRKVPKYTPMVQSIGIKGFEVLILETVEVTDANHPPKEPAIFCDVDFYVMVTLPFEEEDRKF